MDSPTLLNDWLAHALGTNPVFYVTRMSDVYSQYAYSATGVSVGRALHSLALQAAGDMQNLFAAIDFSNPNGSGVRSALRQLAPTVYDNTSGITTLIIPRILLARKIIFNGIENFWS